MKKVAILSIGDEVLIGQVLNTNAQWIAAKLSLLGVQIVQMLTIADTETAITQGVKYCMQQADWILCTGGLGPTKDDITKQTLATFFNKKMAMDNDILAMLSERYRQRGRNPEDPSLRTIAMLPQNIHKIIPNQKGTAPAMWFRQEGKEIISLPGVPYEMEYFMEQNILPELQKLLPEAQTFFRYLNTVGIGETQIAAKIVDIEDALPPTIKLAYLPSLGTVRLRLTAQNLPEKEATKVLNEFATQINERIASYVYAQEDISLEAALGKMLTEKKLTLALAESCTGGYIGHKITTIPGSSAYFMGSMVVYSYEAKEKVLGVSAEMLEKHGAVSEAVVIAMAEGVRNLLKTDFAVSVSGIAGPGGATPDKPVGTVWFAVAGPQGTIAQRLQFTSFRDLNIPLSANAAMNMLRKVVEAV
ncbi:MAG: competence/damage-inducible protein A [Chitinophagales bacterium]|nr:competence/damage-inducible protein A [Bacteroidota bacterium]MCB9042605.1 competence/damage-inducible protein A [Chitinophagales bacterium]